MTDNSRSDSDPSNQSSPDDGDGPASQPVIVERVGWPENYDDEVSLLSIVNVLLRERGAIMVSMGVAAALALLLTFMQGTTYTATGSFVPQSEGGGQLSSLAGAAAQFGITIPAAGSGDTRSPQFYADLLESRWLLTRVAAGEYRHPEAEADSTATTLAELLEVEASSREEAIASVIEILADWTSVSTDPETGLVQLSVTAPWPGIADQIGERMLHLVNQFNVKVRQSQAAEERRFVQDRLSTAREELHAAEQELETFLQQNRRYQNSPQLRFEYERLQRRVDLRQQVYTSLAQSLEEARIREVKNTPVITVVDSVQHPVRADPSHLPRNLALGLFLGTMIGVGLAFVREFGRQSREEASEEYREYELLKKEAKREVKGGLEAARRLIGGD